MTSPDSDATVDYIPEESIKVTPVKNVPKRLGDLNGWWARLFKFNNVLIPIIVVAVLGWGRWVTQSIHQADIERTEIINNQFTGEAGTQLSLRVSIEELKNTVLKKDVVDNLSRVKEISSRLTNHLLEH